MKHTILSIVAVLALALPLPAQTPKAQIDAIVPRAIPSGSPDTRFTLVGTDLDQSSGVYVLDENENWIELPFEKRATSTLATVVIPSQYFSTSRFVRISAEQAFQNAQSVLVYSQSTAHAVVDPKWKVSVVPEDIGTGGQILIHGNGFEPGLKVVLGRANVAGVALTTHVLSDADVEADIPFYVPGDDLFVAVLSADGRRMSAPFGVSSIYPEREDDVSQGVSGPSPDEVNDEGSRLMKRGKYGVAATKFVEAARVGLCRGIWSAPKACALYANNAGFAYYKLAKYEESITWIEKAVQIDSNRAVAWLNLGDVCVKLNQNAEAREAYTNYLKLAPTSKSVPDVMRKLAGLQPVR